MGTGTLEDPVKVAVVGTGLSGLATAYLLSTSRTSRPDGSKINFEVHVFEKSDTFGMDNSSITIKSNGKEFRVDTPMRSINGGSHDRVSKLYKNLKIPLRVANFTYSFSRLSYVSSSSRHSSKLASRDPPPYSATAEPGESQIPPRPKQKTIFLYEGSNGMRWPPLSLPSSIASATSQASYAFHLVLLSFSYLHLLLLSFIYHRLGLLNPTEEDSEFSPGMAKLGLRNVSFEPLNDWCRRHWVWETMRIEVLEPLIAAVATVGREEVGLLPVGEVLGYIVSTFGSSHYVAATGVREVVERLTSCLPPPNVHLSSTISLHAANSRRTTVCFTTLSSDPDFDSTNRSIEFEHVILATQANQAAVILRSFRDSLWDRTSDQKAEQARIDALSAFEYVRTLVVNHRDESLLPNKRDRRDLNLATFSDVDVRAEEDANDDEEDLATKHTVARSSVQATHIISRTHKHLGRDDSVVLQTTNPIVPVKPHLVLSETWYERARVTVGSKKVLPRFLLPERWEQFRKGRGDLQGARGIWFAGSYVAPGIPLLEGCVTSAESVARGICRLEGGEICIPY
ncbi:hypothetical protein T439DRAFT_326421 [Meredithblackwellia eburnea MCA 4105]